MEHASVLALLTTIDEYLLVKVLNFVIGSQLVVLRGVSHQFHRLLSDIKLWRRILRTEFNWPQNIAAQRCNSRKKREKERLKKQMTNYDSIPGLMKIYTEKAAEAEADQSDVLRQALRRLLTHSINRYIQFTDEKAKKCQHLHTKFFKSGFHPVAFECKACSAYMLVRPNKRQLLKLVQIPNLDMKEFSNQVIGTGDNIQPIGQGNVDSCKKLYYYTSYY